MQLIWAFDKKLKRRGMENRSYITFWAIGNLKRFSSISIWFLVPKKRKRGGTATQTIPREGAELSYPLMKPQLFLKRQY